MVLDYNNLSSEYTKRLNEIANEIKGHYTSAVDDYCRKYGDNYLFWATPFVSRNIYNDNTFLHICRVVLANELISHGEVDKIVTQTRGEYRTLKCLLPGNIGLYCSEKKKLLKSACNAIDRWRHFFYYLKRHMAYIKYAGNEGFKYPGDCAVVVGPAISTDFDGYHFNDRYTTGITGYNKILFIPYLVNTRNIPHKVFFDRIKNCDNYDFLNDRDILRGLDVLEILKYWRYINKIKNDSFSYKNLDISPIVKQSLERGKNCSPSFDALVLRKTLQRLAIKRPDIGSFVQWYEGKPFDVVVSTTIRECFPGAMCVGYEGYPLPENNLGGFISEYQYRSGHAPTHMAIPSREYEQDAHQFCKDVQLLYVPIIRNEYVLRSKEQSQNTQKTILVLLAYTTEFSVELLRGVREYIRGKEDSYHVLIKNHPTNDGFTLKNYGLAEDFDVRYVKGKLTDCLQDVDVVVTTMTSGTLEVLYAGIPLVILYLRGQLGYTAIPKSVRNKLCSVVYSREEICVALSETLAKNSPDNSILEGLLVPNTRENVLAMFRR